ncbi:acyltransferase [Amylibacter sp.]|nr:acyltransferase [Amylibacter sp.]
MKYRAEIDGLRALAVVPVILFHAGFELFSGGFVGVDVFFVISGYLITTILIEDLENQRFSLVNFYERRARQILPALFFVILVCIPFAWMWMLPNQMKDFSQSLVAVSLFASNVLFWRESGYFDAAAEEKPLLHTWSLAVEEQYYVLFPIFLFLAWRYGKNRVFWMIVVMASISLLLSEWGWRNNEIANFYLAPTRAWELFAGSISAFIVQKNGVQKNNSLALLGLAAIIFSIFFYDETTPFPSVYALVPVLGVVLLVLYADKTTFVAKLLSTKGFVGVGLISYSAYLWHQPLFAFARIRSLEHPSPILMLSLSAISILLAYCSWRYIEKPFRGKLILQRQAVFLMSFVALIITFTIGMFGHFSNGYSYRMNNIPGWTSLQAIPVVETTHCHNAGRRTLTQLQANDYCILGNGELNTAIIGDSHAGALFDAAENYLETRNISAIAVSGGFCAPLLNGFSARNDCVEIIKEAFLFAINHETIDTIIIAAEWANYTSGYRDNLTPELWQDDEGKAETPSDNVAIFARSFSKTFSVLSETGKRIIIFHPVPEFNQFAYDFIGQSVMLNHAESLSEAVSLIPSITLQEYYERNKDVLEVFEMHSSPNIDYINVIEIFCDTELCRQYDETGSVLYSDSNHVNLRGANKIISYLPDSLER